MITSDTKTLAQASVFRKLRALIRTMRKGTAWRLEGDAIRIGSKDSRALSQCPLTFVGNKPGHSGSDARNVAQAIGFNEVQGDEIITAADHSSKYRLRRILICAAGLKEQP